MKGFKSFMLNGVRNMKTQVFPILVVAIVCVVIVLQTVAGGQLVGFFRETQIEVRKVVWPSGKETTQTTLVVMGLVLAVGVFLWFLDMFLLWSVKMLTGQGG